MQIAIGVVIDRPLLEAFSDEEKIDAARSMGEGTDGDLECRKSSPRIPVTHPHEELHRLFVDIDFEFSQPPFAVFDGSLHDLSQFVARERLEGEHLTATEKCSVDREEWVFRGGSNEDDDAFFDVGQEGILLSLIEAVDFIEKEERALPGRFEPFAGSFEDRSEFPDAAADGAELFESGLRFGGQEPGECRLAAAGRPIEEDRPEPVSFEEPPQEFAFGEKMPLADEFGERPRAHASGQGLSLLAVPSFGVIEKRSHTLMISTPVKANTCRHRRPVSAVRPLSR